LLVLATACAGIFFGAAIYINLVEHPARMSCGQELAVREFGPSYARASIMQAALAIVGCVIGFDRGLVRTGPYDRNRSRTTGLGRPVHPDRDLSNQQATSSAQLDPRSVTTGVLLAR